MPKLNPEIWKNPTLGEAANLDFADEVEAQNAENRAARIEGREPMVVKRLHRYPGAIHEIPVASSYDDGLRKYDPETGELGVGEFGQVSPDGEPENPGYSVASETEGSEFTVDGN